ncbi:copper chaperone PCu(A)C [Demequina sp. NBRC 110057]|uniref:copper chaperone PCu(A)C n=1 Tax=Demequina sp. NBRC 110057 TaxID=1570346 RepID=UPI0009FEB87F|nr:copper chaperone PCu(A)C [Demequina sp. NBRC 110057]
MNAVRTPARLVALAAIATLSLAACSSDSDAEATADAAASGEITITDPWVKTVESGMTAAFGELVNGTDEAVTLVSAETPASSETQLHETLSDESGGMSMSEKEGGFEIAPGESLTLEPGGNHLMLMDVTEPIEAGAQVEFTLTFEDGSTFEFTADAKDYTGAQESYAPEEDMEMDMGSDS